MEEVDVRVNCELKGNVSDRYKVIEPFEYNGKKYKVGQLVEPKWFNDRKFFQALAMYQMVMPK